MNSARASGTGLLPPAAPSVAAADAASIPSRGAPDMIWQPSHRADPKAREIADRHYNRQKIGSPQFVPPGRCLVLYTETASGKAFWVTSWPFAEYVKHAWGGAWICSAFRNEGAARASNLIRGALAATRHHYGDPPPLGMITFLDRDKVRPRVIRGHRTWGHSWRRAGFREVGDTKGGLIAMQCLPADMPRAEPFLGAPMGDLFGEAA